MIHTFVAHVLGRTRLHFFGTSVDAFFFAITVTVSFGFAGFAFGPQCPFAQFESIYIDISNVSCRDQIQMPHWSADGALTCLPPVNEGLVEFWKIDKMDF
uniref:Uncharacterized protein n=1 Tax=Romanomermis culicivorax TaxID=13658 RepID=A0A915JW87_ROMCU